ncbi:MAG: VOC family protein [Thermincola sp.]|nr:VOC family protein [Thermincola sp.]MDT3702040.1 VOC family protein [Thermincola sp.]
MYKFSHVGIVVQDMDKAVDFYTNVLGCEVHSRHQDETIQFALLKSGHQEIELLKFPHDGKERKEGVISHIAFKVTDIEKEISRLKELGVALSSDQPREVMKGMKIFFFTGPSGESIEFLQLSNS